MRQTAAAAHDRDAEDPFLVADLAQATAAPLGADMPAEDAADPYLTADIALATAASLGAQTVEDNTNAGASSSRRPADAPGSPSKRRRANSAGDAAPAPFTGTPTTSQPIITPLALAPGPVTTAVTPAPAPPIVPAAAALTFAQAAAAPAQPAPAPTAPAQQAPGSSTKALSGQNPQFWPQKPHVLASFGPQKP
ncbi:hypothetical protein B0H10DRAFT_2223722 [Mycena sp. CBHHK59/15]|nr:hypothetical protein B0H10DRAFT_2223722 [Mycena sp. CBHHK59/15]